MKHGIDPDLGDGVVVYKSVLFNAFIGASEAFRSGVEAAIHDACDWFLTVAMTHLRDDHEWEKEDKQALRHPNGLDYWDPEGALPKETWRKRMAVAIHYLSQKGVLWFRREAPQDERETVTAALRRLEKVHAQG